MCYGMIEGGRPVISALVMFPGHLVSGKAPPPLEFLIDTGADLTLISALDAPKLDIEYRVSAQGRRVPHFDGVPLEQGPQMGGIGGGIDTYRVRDVRVIFPTLLDDCIEWHHETLSALYIPAVEATSVPNLLGRDILDRFNMYWNRSTGRIDMDRASTPGLDYAVQFVSIPASPP